MIMTVRRVIKMTVISMMTDLNDDNDDENDEYDNCEEGYKDHDNIDQNNFNRVIIGTTNLMMMTMTTVMMMTTAADNDDDDNVCRSTYCWVRIYRSGSCPFTVQPMRTAIPTAKSACGRIML